MHRPRPRTYFLVGAIALLLARIALKAVLQTPFDQLVPILEKVLEMALAGLILVAGYRAVYRKVPEGYAGVIWSNGHRSCTAYPTGERVFVLPWDRFELHDLREKHLDLNITCITRDRIRVTVRVGARWQINFPELLAYLYMGVDGAKILERLFAVQLTHDIIGRALDEVQRDLRMLAFHLERHVGWNIYGARMYSILVLEPQIISISLPNGITAVAEQAKQQDLERQVARHHRVLSYVDRLADAQARAQELLTLNQAMQDISPAAVEFMELLELARGRNPAGPTQPASRAP